MRSTLWAAALGLVLALAGACGKTEEEKKNQGCLDYCAAVEAACPAGTTFAQYPAHGLIECYDYCDGAAALALGSAGDTSGDTVACRLTHAELALADPATHCVSAGPTGGNVCGTWCENYCTLALRNCTFFADRATCLTTCAGFPTNGPLDAMSDSVQCRVMEAAESGVRATCCAHAAPISTACQ
jgi:hypothetical protein